MYKISTKSKYQKCLKLLSLKYDFKVTSAIVIYDVTINFVKYDVIKKK